MAEPYLGEIRLFPWGWDPESYTLCDGRILPISQNTALFSLIGNTYGGDGRTTFALPDLRGRVPIAAGINQTFGYTINRGDKNGSETVALTTAQMPAHNHRVTADNSLGKAVSPLTSNTCLWSQAATSSPPPTALPVNPFSDATASAQLDPSVIDNQGGGQPHQNMQPYLVLNFCIATSGVYPQRPS